MVISLAEQHDLAIKGEFINLVRQAMATVALSVMNENPATLDGGNDEYLLRQSLAQRVIRNAPEVAKLAAFIFATKSPTTDPSGIQDNAYIAVVSAEWSAIAGYNSLYVPEV
ncbi:MAG: hypothetical protein DRI46_11815 [Chloroflexi bacterium]|nr:MAG: hypothetical protein DRI46_11815 [Chloroflexota bacterium]